MPTWLASLFDGGAIKDIVDKALDFIPDPVEKAKASAQLQAQIMAAAAQAAQAQTDINKAEASNQSVFVAGWRPFIGWVCGAALAYQYLVRPIGSFIASYILHVQAVDMPGLDDQLWQLMMGMLGLGGLRTYEKVQGVASGNQDH